MIRGLPMKLASPVAGMNSLLWNLLNSHVGDFVSISGNSWNKSAKASDAFLLGGLGLQATMITVYIYGSLMASTSTSLRFELQLVLPGFDVIKEQRLTPGLKLLDN